MIREKNLKIRVGMRVFLECNKGKKFTGKQICDFLNNTIKPKKWSVNPGSIGKLFNSDQATISSLLFKVQCEKTNHGHRVYWIE